jgi:hypothetical protein
MRMRAHSGILAIVGFLALGCGAHEARSQRAPSSDEKTIWGRNMAAVAQVDRALRAARGRVEDSTDAPVDAALVEVFNHPEAAIRDQRPNRIDQKRLVFCRTDKMLRFSFDLPDGGYGIKVSKSEGFDVTSFLVKVRNSAPNSSKPLIVALQLEQSRRIRADSRDSRVVKRQGVPGTAVSRRSRYAPKSVRHRRDRVCRGTRARPVSIPSS